MLSKGEKTISPGRPFLLYYVHYDQEEEGYDILIVCHDCGQRILSINSDGKEDVRCLVGFANAKSVK